MLGAVRMGRYSWFYSYPAGTCRVVPEYSHIVVLSWYPTYQSRREVAQPQPLGSKGDLARCRESEMACPLISTTSTGSTEEDEDWEWWDLKTDTASGITDISIEFTIHCSPNRYRHIRISISYLEDLYSCGGCSTLATGLDCTAIPGVLAVSCSLGSCIGKSSSNHTPSTPNFTLTLSPTAGCPESADRDFLVHTCKPGFISSSHNGSCIPR